MKRVIPIIVIIAFLTCPMVSYASYLIWLKNGGKLITYHYWEEGNQIMFYIYGGILGIQKDFVREIKESDLIYREETVEQKKPETAKIQEKKADTENKKENEKVDLEYYRKKRAVLKDKLDEALRKYQEVSETKDYEAKKKVRKELTKLSGQLFDLADEVKKKNKGMLPTWWEE